MICRLYFLVLTFLLTTQTLLGSESGQSDSHDTKSTSTLRIISLTPSITETLFTIGAGEQVIGRTKYCLYPPEAKTLQTLGGYFDLELEKVLKMKPDLVVMMKGAHSVEAQLKQLNINVLSYQMESISDIREVIKELSSELQTGENGERALRNFDQEINTVKENSKSVSKKGLSALLVMDRQIGNFDEMFSTGPGTFLEELILLMGLSNSTNDADAPYPTVSLESIIKKKPEVIIEVRTGTLNNMNISEASVTREWTDLYETFGLTPPKVILIEDPHLTIPGPGITESLKSLQHKLNEKLSQ